MFSVMKNWSLPLGGGGMVSLSFPPYDLRKRIYLWFGGVKISFS
jgi:hypothetical protein